jgi:hypothetical protein
MLFYQSDKYRRQYFSLSNALKARNMEVYHTLLITVSKYSAVFATHIMTYLSAQNIDNF